jgi:hypothetical protein
LSNKTKITFCFSSLLLEEFTAWRGKEQNPNVRLALGCAENFKTSIYSLAFYLW